jgi:L-ascorbate metabolism protein UlaG (beta-lactamase superfamily)
MSRLGKLAAATVVLAAFAVATGAALLSFWPSFGGIIEGERSARVRASPQFRSGRFENTIPQTPRGYAQLWDYLQRQVLGSEVRTPPTPIPVVQPVLENRAGRAPPGLRAIWFGHASVYLELDGLRLMADPILSDYASPFAGIGPKRFHPPPLALEALPKIDVVVISHDHYDHLDVRTIKHGGVTITGTPVRHYSGRGLRDGNATLWSSWVIAGPMHRVYFSGDSGFGEHFKVIGDRLGPFDLSILKIGAYGPGQTWHDIHMEPEEAVKAHIALRARRMLPVHWGTFNLAFHAWDEPIERAVAAGRDQSVDLVTPRVGEAVAAGAPFASVRWWVTPR